MSIAAIIPTYQRPEQLQYTIEKLLDCQPPPDEIIVHVDAGDTTSHLVLSHFPTVRLIHSNTTAGPGGGRNKLIAACQSDWIASFDDDSWPLDSDFFARALQFASQLQADIIACQILEKGLIPSGLSPTPYLAATFEGCGCIIHRQSFLSLAGYLPLRYAYGMEETDVALQLLDQNKRIVRVNELRIFHNCDRSAHHSTPAINSAQISNIILLAFLRYPLVFWPYAVLQCLNRILFAIRTNRYEGIIKGLFDAPAICWRYRSHRHPVSLSTILYSRRLRSHTHMP